MVEAMDVAIAGEPMRLLADRALYWPARARLLIADLHLGKADTFRSAGIALPRGGTAHDLARLQRLVEATCASSIWILGDVVHARAIETSWRQAWNAFRTRCQIPIAVVDGNHDRALRGLRLDLTLLGDGIDDGPFVLRHAPPRTPMEQHVLCGHLHPVVRLPGHGRQPAFWLRPDCTVLPAFSAFTGGHMITPQPPDRLVLCDGSALVALG